MTTAKASEHRTTAGGRLVGAVIALMLVVAALATPPADGLTQTDLQAYSWGSTTETDAGWNDATEIATSYDPANYVGSMHYVAHQATGAAQLWSQGVTGAGVDVAVIDSGVVPVNGLTGSDKVINGPDLSFESQADNLRHFDTFGHGTHIAGIIAGRDEGVDPTNSEPTDFVGIAPGARIVNLKVADVLGAVDVTQVIAALDWVVQHRYDNGMNIRVVNLAYGTDGVQDYQLDPLAQAVERAWHAGIVVVVAAGNDGNAAPLRNPAYDPFVIAVGAASGSGTTAVSDDVQTDFTACGTVSRRVDVVAPGASIVSLRNPGSHADQIAPEAVVANRFFLGSGTSQAAAVVSGGVALMLDAQPQLTPDEVKFLLTTTTTGMPQADPNCIGAGQADFYRAATTSLKKKDRPFQKFDSSYGMGSLEAARGSQHVYDYDVPLVGEMDIMGNAWDGYCYMGKRKLECVDTLWDGGSFNGSVWSGNSWSGNSWSGNSWSGNSWSGNSWSGNSWSGRTWSGNSWSGNSWSGNSWSGGSWSGGSWSSNSWSGLSWD